MSVVDTSEALPSEQEEGAFSPEVDKPLSVETLGVVPQQEEQVLPEEKVPPAEDFPVLTKQTVVVIVPILNLRQGPDVKHPIIKRLNQGTVLTVERMEKGWLYVQDSDTTEGWVAAHFTRDSKTGKRGKLADLE